MPLRSTICTSREASFIYDGNSADHASTLGSNQTFANLSAPAPIKGRAHSNPSRGAVSRLVAP